MDKNKKIDLSKWVPVFDFANAGNAPFAVMGDPRVSEAEFTIKDVEEVIAASEGFGDQSWIIVVLLKDGRYASLNADYDGEWNGDAAVAYSLKDIVNYGLDDDNRALLGLLPETYGEEEEEEEEEE